jgi:hypothetical protein
MGNHCKAERIGAYAWSEIYVNGRVGPFVWVSECSSFPDRKQAASRMGNVWYPPFDPRLTIKRKLLGINIRRPIFSDTREAVRIDTNFVDQAATARPACLRAGGLT